MAFGEHTLEHWPSGYAEALPAWADEAVNGDATLIAEGSATDCGGCGGGRAPRTAVGYDEDKETLWLVAVDGRTSSSAGMTIDELAVLMDSLGAWRAMNLDGSGSTTLWTATGGVLNAPSDGSERTVANHLGVFTPGSGLARHCPTGWAAGWGSLDFPGASGTTITAEAGSTVTGSMSVLNTGTETWDTTATKLAPLPRDADSALATDDWATTHRVTTVDATTAPGETGTFSFSLRVPDTVGSSTRFEFSFLQESVAWFGNSWGPEDGTLYLTVVATEPVVDTGTKDSPTDSLVDSAGGTGLPHRDPAAEELPWARERLTPSCAALPIGGWSVTILAIALARRRR
ncbi:MAG: phosphodiester glycosidase family protein [Proteobacteria bacterium]|nr:phosphodiester glycosidase family protein [Pseudomonadota bacterium]